MKTKLLIILMLLCTQIGFTQWVHVGTDIDGEAAFDYSANTHHLAISGDGNIVAFSAPDNDTNGMKSGLVRVYRNVNNVWTQLGNDLRGQASDDYFGSSLGLSKSGDMLAITGGGEIKIFNNTNNNWVESDNSIFGQNRKLSGRNLTINADGSVIAVNHETNDEIIIYNSSLSGWVVSKVLSIEDVSSSTLKLNESGNTLIIGNKLYNADGTEGGRVLVYENVDNDWSQKGASIIGTNNEQTFGSSVDINEDGNIITFGSPHTEVNGKTQAGFVRTYKFENDDWIQIGTDIKGLVEQVSLGRSVSLNIDGSILAVGSDGKGSTGNSRGIAQIFKFENNDWVQIHSTIVGEASKDAFGSSIALNDDGSIVAIGASDNDGNGSNAGHVRVLKNDTFTAVETTIPDANFEQYLIQNNIDTDGIINTKVLTADIKDITQLDLSSLSISDLKGIQNFTALKYLTVWDNQLTEIDLTQNTNLETLAVGRNQLTGIDISNNTKLIEFGAGENQITSIDVSKNTDLTHVAIALNQLSSLDISNNNKLIDLKCEGNNITALNVSNLTDLETLWIFKNQITIIDLSKNLKLKTLGAHENKLTDLDVSKNIVLEAVTCYLNQLKTLDVKNGNNTSVSNFEAQQNPDLKCINVDDADYSSNSNIIWTKGEDATFSETCGEGTYIPDVNFETYIESLGLGNSIEGDGFVDTNKIAAITALDISDKNIANLTGIEAFTALVNLDARENQITSINLSQNFNLEILNLFSNSISLIDFSNNSKLKELHVGTNNLQSLNVSTLSNLTKLWCFNNQISLLNISNNTLLQVLNCSTNQINALNTSFNLELEVLYADDNVITLLDLRNNSKLSQLTITNNLLSTLNVKNGNNTNVTAFFTTGNQSLTCIEVDDESYSETTWNDANAAWNAIDAHTSFNTDCPKLTAIPDPNFEAYLESINAGNGVDNDGLVSTSNIQNINTLNIADKNITDITGIEAFDSLKELDCRNNAILSVDFSKNITLEKLFIANNQLTTIDFSKNLGLKNIDVGENILSNLDIHLLTDLVSISCYKNQLTTINLYSNKKLQVLVCNENQLKNLDIRENKDLFWIDVDDNTLESLTIKNGNNSKITTFSVKGNANLTCIEVDDVAFSTSNWPNKDAQTTYSTDCAPANDDCNNAIPLTFGQETPGDINSGNSNDNATCATGTVLADVWFSMLVPATGEFSVEGSGFGGQLKFAVYQSCASLAPISCGENISLTNLTPGTKFYLKVWLETASDKNANNQSETGTFVLKVEESSVLSLNNLEILETELSLFPNPASSFINIKSLNNPIDKVELFNAIGKRVLIKNGNQEEELRVNTSTLSTGIYFIKALINNKVISKKLIIN